MDVSDASVHLPRDTHPRPVTNGESGPLLAVRSRGCQWDPTLALTLDPVFPLRDLNFCAYARIYTCKKNVKKTGVGRYRRSVTRGDVSRDPPRSSCLVIRTLAYIEAPSTASKDGETVVLAVAFAVADAATPATRHHSRLPWPT
ncbi:hypothetical protein GW17_00017805 [Ensete ventricosum]|nr:hypothetical protein GW17_00017805 [Ensete ventricosum]